MIIALRSLQMKGLPVDPHDVVFFRSHSQVGAAGFDFDAGGVHTWYVDDERNRVGVFQVVVVGLTERDGRRRLGCWAFVSEVPAELR